MSSMPVNSAPTTALNSWLRSYYLIRAAVSVAWILLALFVGRTNPVAAAILLVAYPAWDAFANYLDAGRNGGLRSNPTQGVNLVISAITALAVAIALGFGMGAVFAVFGAWAALSGLLQLLTAVGRWKSAGAQWVMILSGAQSALAGGFFLLQSQSATTPDIAAIAGYAAFGAFYFLLSAGWLIAKDLRSRRAIGA
jgi:hypothetical protein